MNEIARGLLAGAVRQTQRFSRELERTADDRFHVRHRSASLRTTHSNRGGHCHFRFKRLRREAAMHDSFPTERSRRAAEHTDSIAAGRWPRERPVSSAPVSPRHTPRMRRKPLRSTLWHRKKGLPDIPFRAARRCRRLDAQTGRRQRISADAGWSWPSRTPLLFRSGLNTSSAQCQPASSWKTSQLRRPTRPTRPWSWKMPMAPAMC